MVRLILASSSPRRSRLLTEARYDFVVLAPEVDESMHPRETPRHYALRLAREKASACAASGALALGADTVVVYGGEALGKPRDSDHAVAMLTRLSGSAHEVLTGWALATPKSIVASGVEATRVEFRELSTSEVQAYVDTGEPLDRAGAYAIQGGAAGFVSHIDGSYGNVVGLPTEVIAEALTKAKINPAGTAAP